MKALVLAAAARRDLSGIAAYTADRWGSRKKTEYLGVLRSRMEELRRTPLLGPVRSDLGQNVRSLQAGRHRILYRAAADQVIILRVVHERMDVRQAGDE